MGLLNIFSKWKITCIILFPVQKDSELVSLFIQYKTMITPRAHFSLRGPCWTTSAENCLDGFNMKVTFFVIKTWLSCNHSDSCKGWDAADMGCVNWDIAAQASLSSQAWMQTEHSLGRVKLFIFIFLLYVSGFGECDLPAMGSMCLWPSIQAKQGLFAALEMRL